MGLKVTAADVSRTALAIGEELFRRQPPIGERPPPRFLHFDGRRLELPDGCVDRVFCLDAFHHVPNQREVLAELARVLRDGGVAGFSEPGPEHSRTPQSQYEMRTFGVVENDVRIEEIWDTARAVGFTDVRLALFSVPGMLVSWPEYIEFLAQGDPSLRFGALSRRFMAERRTFFLYKGTPPVSAAEYRAGLRAVLAVAPAARRVRAGEEATFRVTATNAGTAVWQPHGSGLGGVSLGAHLYDEHGVILRHSYHWESLTPGDGAAVAPGESVVREAIVPAPAPGRYLLEFDLVAADVVWFGLNGSATPRVELEVVAAEVEAGAEADAT
jgi:SAM-dependent methyltransferase